MVRIFLSGGGGELLKQCNIVNFVDKDNVERHGKFKWSNVGQQSLNE